MVSPSLAQTLGSTHRERGVKAALDGGEPVAQCGLYEKQKLP